MSRKALVLLVCCCDFRDGAERLIPSKSLGNAVIRAFPGLFRILRMCAPRHAAAVVRPRERKKSADRRRRILISRLLIIRASVPRRKSPFPAYFKGFPAVSLLIPPYPAFLKYPVSPQFGGLLLAILLWQSELVSKILEPYLVVLNSLPKIALGPVIIIWVGAGTEAIIVMAVAISMIVTVLEMLEGFRSTDPELIRMAETFGASRQQIFRKIVFPANIPVLFNSLKINIGLSLVGVIAGEFLVSKAGLGYLIVYGGQVFQLDLVMTGVIILALMAVGMYRCITLVENRVLRGRRR